MNCLSALRRQRRCLIHNGEFDQDMPACSSSQHGSLAEAVAARAAHCGSRSPPQVNCLFPLR